MIEIEVFRIKKSLKVSKDSSKPSPFPIAAHCSEREVRLWGLFVLGLLAARCSERETRVMVVVGDYKFLFFLFPFQLRFQKSEKVRVKFSAFR